MRCLKRFLYPWLIEVLVSFPWTNRTSLMVDRMLSEIERPQ
jgi:hypothetical protein